MRQSMEDRLYALLPSLGHTLCVPRFDLKSGYTWLFRCRPRSQWPIWATGPFRTFELRIPLFRHELKISRQLTRWL